MDKTVVLITRIKDRDNIGALEQLLQTARNAGIKDAYIVLETDGQSKDETNDGINIHLVHDDDPTGPVSMNAALRELARSGGRPDAFLVVSREVVIQQTHINSLCAELEANDKLLVAGYRLKIETYDGNLNDELQKYYGNGELIAFSVPWNTCAMWNYGLFQDYVGKFDEITTTRNPFPPVNVTIDGASHETPHKGMEDGLAIAKAVSVKKGICFKLLDERLPWAVNVNGHREKLARKDLVMRNFMALRDYSVDDLNNAKLN